MFVVKDLSSEFFDSINEFVENQRKNGMPASTTLHPMDERGHIEKYGDWNPPNAKRFINPIPPKITDEISRDCKICWFPTNDDDEEVSKFYDHFKNILNWINGDPTGWNFDIDILEDIQYTEYEVGQYYDWHIDTNEDDLAKVRKISFVLLLGDEFEGGELQLETRIPKSKPVSEKYGDAPRYETVPLKNPGDIVFFHSDIPHRVTPVTSGTRRTLVGWVAGPHFK